MATRRWQFDSCKDNGGDRDEEIVTRSSPSICFISTDDDELKTKRNSSSHHKRWWLSTTVTTIEARALWSGSSKNTDVSTGPFVRPIAWLLAPLTRLLALHYSLRLRAALRSTALTRSLRSLPHSWESELLMSQNDLVLSNSVVSPWRDGRRLLGGQAKSLGS